MLGAPVKQDKENATKVDFSFVMQRRIHCGPYPALVHTSVSCSMARVTAVVSVASLFAKMARACRLLLSTVVGEAE